MEGELVVLQIQIKRIAVVPTVWLLRLLDEIRASLLAPHGIDKDRR